MRRKAAPLQAARPAAPLRPRLELPVSTRSPARDVVIQPDQPPDIPMQIPHPLPTAFLWAQGPVPLQETRVVGAPERPPLPRFSLPHSDPLVRKPNREAPIGDLQVATPPDLPLRAPKLPVFAANVAPVRLPAPSIEPPRELPASALPPGSPMNLIALMSLPAPPSPSYILEVGNRLAPPPAGGPSSSEAAAADAPKAPPGAPPLEELLKSAAAAQPPGTAGAGKPAARSLPEATSPAGTEKANVPAADLLDPALDIRPAPDPRGPTDTARGEPGPRGNLGIVIVRPSPQETEIDAREVLSGQPVYTVYFDVPGAPRRWILHYCVPGSASPAFVREGDSVVRILPRRSVQAPYPVHRTPVDLTGYRGEASRLMVYALVNERGETENVRLVRGAGHEVDARAVAVLRSWVFRPALRGDSPVAVEALFGIPLN